jgi:hypothetical protein
MIERILKQSPAQAIKTKLFRAIIKEGPEPVAGSVEAWSRRTERLLREVEERYEELASEMKP